MLSTIFKVLKISAGIQDSRKLCQTQGRKQASLPALSIPCRMQFHHSTVTVEVWRWDPLGEHAERTRGKTEKNRARGKQCEALRWKTCKGGRFKSRDREEEKISVNKMFQQKDWQIQGSRWISGGFMWIEYTCIRCTYFRHQFIYVKSVLLQLLNHMWPTPGGDSATHSFAKYIWLCKAKHLVDEKSKNSIKIEAHAEVYQGSHISRTNLDWLMEL